MNSEPRFTRGVCCPAPIRTLTQSIRIGNQEFTHGQVHDKIFSEKPHYGKCAPGFHTPP